MSEWHKGPPPSKGWWPASTRRDNDTLRWWNGAYWSWAAYSHEGASRAAMMATIDSEQSTDRIEWRHRPDDWPERSRT